MYLFEYIYIIYVFIWIYIYIYYKIINQSALGLEFKHPNLTASILKPNKLTLITFRLLSLSNLNLSDRLTAHSHSQSLDETLRKKEEECSTVDDSTAALLLFFIASHLHLSLKQSPKLDGVTDSRAGGKRRCFSSSPLRLFSQSPSFKRNLRGNLRGNSAFSLNLPLLHLFSQSPSSSPLLYCSWIRDIWLSVWL